MPQSNYGEEDQVQTFLEHLLPPALTYLVRKLVLGVVLALVFAARQASKPYDFYFMADVTDREAWCWKLWEKLPVYRARVEKVE